MVKIRTIRDRFSPIPFKLEDVTAAVTGAIGALSSQIAADKAAKYASSDVGMTNEMNYRIAHENNLLSEQLFHEANDYNAVQAQLSRDFDAHQAQLTRDYNAREAQLNRDFQSAEAQKTRDWNAVDAQIQRAKNAGINPAWLAGSFVGAGSSATAAGSAASSSPVSGASASASSLPHLSTPQMQNKLPLYQTQLATQVELGKMFSEIQKNVAEAKKTDSETDINQTYKDFQRDILQRGIDVNDATCAKLYQDIVQSDSYIQEINQKVELAKASQSLITEQAEIAKIDKIWRDELNSASLKETLSKAGYNEASCNYIMAKLPLELGVLRSEESLNSANADLAKAKERMTEQDIKMADEQIQILKIDKKQATLDYTVNRTYQMANAREDFRQNKSRTQQNKYLEKQMEFTSGDVVMVTREINGVVNTAANAVNSVTGVYNAKSGRIRANASRDAVKNQENRQLYVTP